MGTDGRCVDPGRSDHLLRAQALESACLSSHSPFTSYEFVQPRGDWLCNLSEPQICHLSNVDKTNPHMRHDGLVVGIKLLYFIESRTSSVEG